MDDQSNLPLDFGARVRAAIAYWAGCGGEGGLEGFASAANRRGMSAATMRKWMERGHQPPLLAQPAIVQRLAEVSGLDEAFFTAERNGTAVASVEARLARIETELAAQQKELQRRQDALYSLIEGLVADQIHRDARRGTGGDSPPRASDRRRRT